MIFNPLLNNDSHEHTVTAKTKTSQNHVNTLLEN